MNQQYRFQMCKGVDGEKASKEARYASIGLRPSLFSQKREKQVPLPHGNVIYRSQKIPNQAERLAWDPHHRHLSDDDDELFRTGRGGRHENTDQVSQNLT